MTHFKTGLYTLVFLVQNEKVLLLKRAKSPNKDFLNGLGGKLEEGETPSTCAVREFKEESGLEIEGLIPCGLLRFVEESGRDYLVFPFLASGARGEIHWNNPEGTLEWYDLNKLSELKLVPNIKVFLPLFLEDPGHWECHFQYLEDGDIPYSCQKGSRMIRGNLAKL